MAGLKRSSKRLVAPKRFRESAGNDPFAVEDPGAVPAGTRLNSFSNSFIDEETPRIQYWIHPESDCLFTTENGKHPGDTCEELTREEYERFEAEGAARRSESVKQERRKVFNPRKRRWEWSDTGIPIDGFGETKKPAQRRSGDVIRMTRERAENMIMPHGTHAGCKLGEIPTHYLKYILNNYTLNAPLAAAIAIELKGRE